MVVKASVESRRAVLGGFLGAVVRAASPAVYAAATPVDIIDDRKVPLSSWAMHGILQGSGAPQGWSLQCPSTFAQWLTRSMLRASGSIRERLSPSF